jgi:hypothetical protein
VSRLTKDVRAQILKRLLDQSPLKEKIVVAKKELVALAIDGIKEKWRLYQGAMDLVPQNFFPSVRSFNIYSDEASGSLRTFVAEGEFKKFSYPYDTPYMKRSIFVSKGSAALRKAYKKYQELLSDQLKLKSDAERILFSCTTLKKLLKVWPEVEGLVPEYFINKQQPTAVSIIPKELIASVNKNIVKV